MRTDMHAFRDMSPDEMEELFSNFLIDSWSYSKVATFARNEKAFEMASIYRNPFKQSASTVAGSAYHEALDCYFKAIQQKESPLDLVSLQKIAYDYIDEVHANSWKLQKTTPTIEKCVEKATKVVNSLLENFMQEVSVYVDEIDEVIGVEIYCSEFVIINGVDIPLPCHCKIDLVFKSKSGKTVIVDHKSKQSFSDEKELRFSIGKQAITYVNCYEEFSSIRVDEVWFVENKHSKNRDKSPQLNCFKIEITDDIRRLYEAMLYESLKRLLEAVSDPDYVYIMNENDSFIDKAEMYEFWAQTMIAEVEDFNVLESKKDLIKKRLRKIKDSSLAMIDPKTIKKFKEKASTYIQYDLSNKNMNKTEKIEHVMRNLGVNVKVAHKFDGYSSDTFLLNVSSSTNISALYRYRMDIANALNVPTVRMMKELFIYEGRSYVAVEASKKRDRDLLFEPSDIEGMKIPIGRDNFDKKVVWDLDNNSTPHVLICGATGSGKSVCIITIIEYAKLCGVDEIVILDPKYEFLDYADDSGVLVHNDISAIETQMEDLVVKMDNMVKNRQKKKIMVIFDEFADAVSNARKGNQLNVYHEVVVGEYKDGTPKTKREVKEVKASLEENLKKLLQKGRSVGFRVVAATQRASVKVITGDAKANLPVQICFRVNKGLDSKVVLDEEGAEGLAGNGDGLIKSPEYMGLVRFQGYYKK